MNTLIIFDSQFGNTKKIAEAIAGGFVLPHKAELLAVEVARLKDLENVGLVIFGSPTHGGRPKVNMQNFLDKIPVGALKNIKVAAFDTRFLEKDLNFALKLLVKTLGYAAPRMAEILKSKGGKVVVPPEGFIVKGKEGPLADGELEKAKTWARKIIDYVS